MVDEKLPKKITILSAKEDQKQVQRLEEQLQRLECETRSYPGHDYDKGGDELALGARIAESIESADLIIALNSSDSDQSRWLSAEIAHTARHAPDKLFSMNISEISEMKLPAELSNRIRTLVPRMPSDAALTESLRGSWRETYKKGRRRRESGQATATEGLDQMESFANVEQRTRIRQLRSHHGDPGAMEIIDDVVDRGSPRLEPVRPSLSAADQSLARAVAHDDWAYKRFEEGRAERKRQGRSGYNATYWWDEDNDVEYLAEHVRQALNAFEANGSDRQAARIRELRREHGDRKALTMIEDAIESERAKRTKR